PVERDEVLLAVHDAGLHELGVELAVVRDQRGVPRLHRAQVDPVLVLVAARMDHVERDGAGHGLRIRGVVVLEQGELRGVTGLCGVVPPQLRDLLLRVVVAVPVAGPVEHREVPRLLFDRWVGCGCTARAGRTTRVVLRLLARCEHGRTERGRSGHAHEAAPVVALGEDAVDVGHAPPFVHPSWPIQAEMTPYHAPNAGTVPLSREGNRWAGGTPR